MSPESVTRTQGCGLSSDANQTAIGGLRSSPKVRTPCPKVRTPGVAKGGLTWPGRGPPILAMPMSPRSVIHTQGCGLWLDANQTAIGGLRSSPKVRTPCPKVRTPGVANGGLT
jgi:hypothetical protein